LILFQIFRLFCDNWNNIRNTFANYSRKGIQLGSKEIPNKFPHSGRNAPIVSQQATEIKKLWENYYKNNPSFVNQF